MFKGLLSWVPGFPNPVEFPSLTFLRYIGTRNRKLYSETIWKLFSSMVKELQRTPPRRATFMNFLKDVADFCAATRK